MDNEIIEDEEFLEEVKRALNITWQDEDTDNNIKDYIKAGIAVLQEDVALQIDFDEDIIARGLLKTYCRYARNNCEEFFIENNLHLILKLEVKYGKS